MARAHYGRQQTSITFCLYVIDKFAGWIGFKYKDVIDHGERLHISSLIRCLGEMRVTQSATAAATAVHQSLQPIQDGTLLTTQPLVFGPD